MESVARPPHRRKHSRNPYDDVFMSGGAEREVLEAHEYAEIFSGSSTIPVLDLSGLEERVGSGDSRSPKLDYSNIFGGFRNEAVPFPFEELFNGSADQPQLRVPSQGSDTLHSGGTSKITSVEASDQSADELKNQFNVSFNRTHQRNTDTSSGKAHVSHLQDVPAFTQFVDVTRLPKTDSGRTVNSLKRDVSRTWSFSAKPDTVRGKGETSREKSHVPDIKPQPRAAYFVPKKDVSEKNASEFSSPYYGEDFDENSVAAASAAALKTAIDQAQESIRLAKMIMHRKKEGYRYGSKSRQRGRPKVSDREGEMDRELKKNNPMEKSDVGIDGKYIPPLVHDDAFISAAKIEVESVCENAAEGKGHGAVLSGKGELFPPNGRQRELHFIDEKIESGKTEENVEAVEMHSVGADIPVLLANEGKTANVEKIDVNVDHVQGPEVVAEFVERALDTSSQRIQELERNVEEAGVWNATFDHAEGPENKAERVLNTPPRTRRQWKVSAEAGEYFGIGLKDGISEERENDMDDKGKKESAKVINVERTTELKSDLDSIIRETCNMGENDTLGKVETERESERKENGYIWKTYDDEANLWFDGEEQPKEALDKKIDPAFFPEIEVGKKSVDEVHEPEVDYQKENHAHDGDEQILPGDIEKNEVEERHTSASECEVPETVDASEINCDQVQNSTVYFNSDENCKNHQYEEDAYEEHINEPFDVNSSSSSTILSETREACNVDLDSNSEDFQTVVENHKENYTISEVIETFSETNKDEEVEHMFHQEDGNEILRTETLHQISPEEIIFQSKPNYDFDSLSSDGSGTENVCGVGADPEEELPEDKGGSRISPEEFTSQKIDLSHVNSSDIRTSESDPEDVGQVVEEASESDEGSVSTSSHENINGFSAHDSEECEEKENDVTPINEELKDELDVVPNESKNAEEKIMGSEGAGESDPNTENNKGKLAGTSPTEEKEAKAGDPQNTDKSDYQQRIEAIKRGREREKDRKVVERAIREARERAFAEARERAERAAVEKATAEARQRAMAEAREKAAFMKLKTERAAVERATAEARERAMEKALSQKTTHVEKRTPEKVSGSSGSNRLKHSFSSSDLENATESAQRRKARLERHQRIMERAAKALAEKNMRDVLAQKEQAERNRLAESLDADVKRWATGKEKNLRALLSTLQYILGPDSGWKPIPLTDIITTVAVKKAYRKATLCVHPDKLQQRGATIKQKYICEKVFDLLKAAWNRFNSDER